MSWQRWVKPEVYPLMIPIVGVLGLVATQLVRNISTNPEVRMSTSGSFFVDVTGASSAVNAFGAPVVMTPVYLTTLNLARFLTETAPLLVEGQADTQLVSAVDVWKHSEFLCRNYVLNGLADALYNVYCKVATTKELWESLEKKYKTEDAGTKEHVVAKFLEFKMVDSKSVMSQVQDLQVLIHDNNAEGMELNESLQVAAMIEKLPPGWIDFKNYLKHHIHHIHHIHR